MEFERAKLDFDGQIGILKLNHPEVMNAVSPAMVGGLMKALDEVLTGALALRPLPVKDAGDVISVYQIFNHGRNRNVHGTQSLFSWPEYGRYRDENRTLSGLAAYAPVEVTFSAPAASRVIEGQLVSCNYFSVVGTAPVLGRDFSGED